jgi:glycosyltransferase involved in cell wall biosynthesis
VRLVFVTDIMTPYMAAVFGALAERCNFRVVFSAEAGSRGTEWAFADGFPFAYDVVGGLKLGRTDNIDLHVDPRLLRALGRARPDAIVVPGFSAPSAFAALYARWAGAGLVIHSDGTLFSELGLGRAQRLARRVLIPQAGACVANSGPAREPFLQYGVHPDRIFRGDHTTRMQPLWDAARRRNGHGGDERALRLLNVGRLIPRKGLDRLLEAVALARAEEPGISLRLVGSGPSEDELRAQAARLGLDVGFGGFVDQPALPGVYADADAFVLPSRMDPFGIVALEAAAAGLPLIGSRYAGATGELVREGETGHVIDPDDVPGMAAVLVALARDPERRRRMGRAAHEATLHRTPEAAAEGYLAAARLAAAEPRAARRPRA